LLLVLEVLRVAVLLIDEVGPDPGCADGAAAAKPLPRPRVAKPRTPAMALEAVSFLTVLMVFMNSLAFQVFCQLLDWLEGKGMALTNTPASGERCVLVRAQLVQML
jgi:hypothetical protein